MDSKTFLHLTEDFEYRQLNDLLNIIRKLEPGEYDLSGVEAIMTASSSKVSLDDIQSFITKYRRVCYIQLEGYSKNAKDLVLMSDEPKRVGMAKSLRETGAMVNKTKLLAYNYE